jgi:acyl-CoA synthetase (AMP-forming)/AMP-acid ligase II
MWMPVEEHCRQLGSRFKFVNAGKIAGFKRPKKIDFIAEADMPRTGTGKILHRVLRERYGHWADHKH